MTLFLTNIQHVRRGVIENEESSFWACYSLAVLAFLLERPLQEVELRNATTTKRLREEASACGGASEAIVCLESYS
jgi:hypothetical protein